MSPLLAIPLEILVHISSYLTTPDLGSLRLTCKQIERSLWDWFAKEFFAKKQFMITQPSLQSLIDISRSPRLSKVLKHVIFSTMTYSHATPNFAQHMGDTPTELIYAQICAEQHAFIGHRLYRDILTEAFRGLEQLETIDIRDFNAKRPRDGTDWDSCGVQTVLEQTGRRPGFHRDSSVQQDFSAQLFWNVLYSAGLADRRLRRLEVLLRRHQALLPDEAFFLSSAIFPAVQHVLFHLEVLHLAVAMRPSELGFGIDSTGKPAYDSRWLRHFLSCTPNLKHLRLNFDRDKPRSNIDFLAWLGEPSSGPIAHPQPAQITAADPEPIQLSQLVTLEMGRMDIDLKFLQLPIMKFAPTLERIALQHICLAQDTHRDVDEHERLWEHFLGDLASVSFPLLSHFSIRAPSVGKHQSFEGIHRHPVPNDGSGNYWEYSGQDLSGFFQTMASKLFLQ